MTEQEKHLESVIQRLNTLSEEFNRLNDTLNFKREQMFKLQGIIEYLNSIGVSLPKDSQKQKDSFEVEKKES